MEEIEKKINRQIFVTKQIRSIWFVVGCGLITLSCWIHYKFFFDNSYYFNFELYFFAGIVIGMLGLHLFIEGLLNILFFRNIKALRKKDRPQWEQDMIWNSKGISDKYINKVLFNLIGPLFFVLFGGSLLSIFFMPLGANTSLWAYFWGIMLLVIFILGIWKGIKAWIQYSIYSKSYLKFLNFPFFTGQKLQVELLNSKLLSVVKKYKVTLRFIVEEYVSDKDSTWLELHQKYEEVIEVEVLKNKLHIELNIPADSPTSELYKYSTASYWEILVESADVNSTFETTFLVPMYAKID